MAFLTLVTCGYKDLYDNYDDVSITDLIDGIPTVNILECIAWFQAQIHC